MLALNVGTALFALTGPAAAHRIGTACCAAGH